MRGKLLKKIAAAAMAGTMLLSFASCSLFGANKEIVEAADTFAEALVKQKASKIIKLTDEKKKSDTAVSFEYLLNTSNYNSNQRAFIKAVGDTMTYEVQADTVSVNKDEASVDVVFTMVDYEKALKKGDFEDIDEVIDAIKDCDDTRDVEVSFEFEKKGDNWLISNLKDDDYQKLFEFYTYHLDISPDLSSLVEDDYLSSGAYWIDYDVYFTEDIEQYYDLFSYDVYYEGSLFASGKVPYVYDDGVWCEFTYDDWSDLASGEYTIVLMCGDKEVVSKSIDVYDDSGYDYDYGGDYVDYASIYSGNSYTYGYGSEVINLWAATDEVPQMVEMYMSLNPSFASTYTVVCTVIPTYDGQYTIALDQALEDGGVSAPDIYAVEAEFVIKYTQGSKESYAATYEDLGIDVDTKIPAAEIAQYTVDIGTNSDGEVVGLGYKSTGGAFIYRRSVAIEVFGTDDPEEIAEIIGGGTGSWDDFWEAADACANKGVAIVSSNNDLWQAVKGSTDSWIKNGSLNTDSGRYEFFDMAYDLTDYGWSNSTTTWTEGWYADMNDTGSKPVLGYFGPAWMINYVIADNSGDTYGDWAVCASPVGFFWGGTWLLANKDTDQPAGVAELIDWITLDTSTSGLQYLWANGLLYDGMKKDSVASEAVMAMSDGTLDFLDGQNMFPVFIEANKFATSDVLSEYDEAIDLYFTDAAEEYSSPSGYYYGDKDAAIYAFEDDVDYYVGF